MTERIAAEWTSQSVWWYYGATSLLKSGVCFLIGVKSNSFSLASERERNLAWSLFMNPLQRQRFVHWERAARGCIAHLRAMRDQDGDEAWVTELIADLSTSSPEFRAWWPEHEILLTCNSVGEIYHLLVGHLAFQMAWLEPSLSAVSLFCKGAS